MDDAFGPLTKGEQINDIAGMFQSYEASIYRPIIGKIISKYGYDVTLYVFGQLRNSKYVPNNIWAYITHTAKQRTKINKEADNKSNHKTKGNIVAMLDSLLLEGNISIEDFESVNNVEEAKQLIEEVEKRVESDQANNH